MAGVFISYRRDDTAGYALIVNKALREQGFEVFMDLDSIAPGERFPKAIEDALDASDALVALIGRRWLTATDQRGRRRLDDRRDYVRREIAAALDRDIPVIPTLVDGVTMPAEAELPRRLAGLAEFQRVELDSERWDYDIERLIGRLGGKRAGFAQRFGTAVRSLPQPGRRTGIAIAAALLAATLVAFFLTRGGGGQKTPHKAFAISRVSSPALGGPGRQVIFGAVPDGGSGLVAVGRERRGTTFTAAAWRSTNQGASWSRSRVSGAESATEQQMRGVARLPGGRFIAVGDEQGEATSWLSSGGTTWEEPHSLVRFGSQVMNTVTATATAVVAAGWQDVGGGSKREAAVWRSTDGGVTWADASGKGFGGDENQEIKDLLVIPNGPLVAVGYDNGIGQAVVWISHDDGQTWGRFGISAREGTEQMAGVVTGAFGLIAVGNESSNEGKHAAVWKSTNNGRVWKRVAKATFEVPGAQEMTGVIASGLGLVAVGSDKSSGQQHAAVWRSTDDGESWHRIVSPKLDAEDGAGSMATVTKVGGVVLALGQGIRGAERDAGVWRTGNS